MISPDLRGDSGGAAAAPVGTAGARAVAAAARATLGAGAGAGCAGAAGRGEGAAVAAGAALEGTGVHAGADAVTNTIPQWTQNFAPGWFSLPHAVHFIDFLPWESGQGPDAGHAHEMRAALRHQSESYYDPIIVQLSLNCDAEASRLSATPPPSPSLQPPLDATIEYVHRPRLDAIADRR
jgi:hypothetical protein